jgi:hypothetical protein
MNVTERNGEYWVVDVGLIEISARNFTTCPRSPA